MYRKPVRVWFVLFVCSACSGLAVGCKDDEEDKKLAAAAARDVAEGALIYFQEQHADPDDPLRVHTFVFPEATEAVCSGDDAAFFEEKLRYEVGEGIEVCYQTSPDQKAFAAWVTRGDAGACVQGDGGADGVSVGAVAGNTDCKDAF